MNLLATLRTALRAVRKNTLRSVLATLGIVIAVAAVLATVALGTGAQAKVVEQMASLGTNLVMVMAGSVKNRGTASGAGGGHSLTLQDGQAIQQELSNLVVAVAPVTRNMAQVVYGHMNWSTTIIGTTAAYLDAKPWALSEGIFLDHDHDAAHAKVCVLGGTVASHLFNGASPLNETIRVKNMPCTVIGVLATRGQGGWGQDLDDVVMMPWSTMTERLFAMPNNIGLTFTVAARSSEATSVLEEQITSLLRQRHRLASDADDDFSVFNLAEMQEAMTAQTKTLALLLSSIALISLVVGAIGIANVMLVSVTERTREIGIRMAVGARRRDVLVQFLAEATLLALIGGALGLLLGSALSVYMARVGDWPVRLSAPVAAATLCLAGLSGVIAGFYPAWRASRLDPIDALRYE